MRQEGGIKYAVLGVISKTPGGTYGYALKSQCNLLLGSFWQLNFGEIYRVLDRLLNDGLIEQHLAEESARQKVYRITEQGKRSLDDFVLAPPNDAPRPLRQELAVKLLFARADQYGELLTLIDHQREAYMRELSRLGLQRRKLARLRTDSFVTGLLIGGAELNARAELAWLDEVTAKLKERFAGKA